MSVSSSRTAAVVGMAALLATFAVVAASAAECKAGEFDLSGVGSAVLSITQTYNGQETPYFFGVDLCTPTTAVPPSGVACAPAGYLNQYSTPQRAGDTPGCLVAFDDIQTPFAPDPASGALVASYKSKDKSWVAQVTLECGTTKELASEPKYTVSGQYPFFTFYFKLSTSAVCPGGGGGKSKDKGSGAAIAFVVILFVGAPLYVAAFAAFGYFKQGKRGKELLPHQEFWGSVPGLIKDGFIFTKDKILQCVGRVTGGGGGGGAGAATYEKV